MLRFDFLTFLSGGNDQVLSGIRAIEPVLDNGESYLLVGSTATKSLTRIAVAQDTTAQIDWTSWVAQGTGILPFNDLEIIDLSGQTRLYATDGRSGQVMVHSVSATGLVSTPTVLRDPSQTPLPATEIAIHQDGNKTLLLLANETASGLELWQLDTNGTASHRATAQDSSKTTLDSVSNVVTVSIGANTYAIATSDRESGMTSHRVTASDDLVFVDAIAARDGLWSSGLNDLEVVEMGGATYLISASSGSSSLASVRINEYGIFFVEDVVHDSLDTRFAGAVGVEHFAVNNRDFIVAGGIDGGVSVFELLPGGTFYHLGSTEMTTDWNVGALSTFEAVAFQDELQLFLAGTAVDGMAQLTLDLGNIGVRWTGTAGNDRYTGTSGDDIIFGYTGDDQLKGGAGDDILFAGHGRDQLYGGAGADIFAFHTDGIRDQIKDFEFGVDRIDLSAWGYLYHFGDIRIRTHEDGARLYFGNNEIKVETSDKTAIEISAWSLDDFIF